MFTESSQFRSAVRVQQIIAAAILGGLAMLIGIVLVLEAQRSPEDAARRPDIHVPIITYVAIGVGLMNFMLAYMIPNRVVNAGLKRIVSGERTIPSEDAGGEQAVLLELRQTAHLMTIALLEGAGFLGAIAYMVEGHVLGLIVAGAMFGLMLSIFPTAGRVRDWLERHQRRLGEMRMR